MNCGWCVALRCSGLIPAMPEIRSIDFDFSDQWDWWNDHPVRNRTGRKFKYFICRKSVFSGFRFDGIWRLLPPATIIHLSHSFYLTLINITKSIKPYFGNLLCSCSKKFIIQRRIRTFRSCSLLFIRSRVSSTNSYLLKHFHNFIILYDVANRIYLWDRSTFLESE